MTSKVVSKSEGRVVAFDGTEEHKVAIVEGEAHECFVDGVPCASPRPTMVSSTPTPASTSPTPPRAPRCSCPRILIEVLRKMRGEIQRRRGVDVAS